MKSLGTSGTVAAAAILVGGAIAVPLLVLDRSDGSRPAGGGSGKVGDAIALDELHVGPEPREGYLADGELRTGAERIALSLGPDADVTELAAMAGGYLVTTADALGDRRVRFVADDGTASSGTWRVEGDINSTTLVVSPERSLGAFVQVDGRAVVLQDGGRTATELEKPRGAADFGFAPVGVAGTTCSGAQADCSVTVSGAVYTGGEGTRDATWTVRPGQRAVEDDRGIAELSAVGDDGLAAGKIKVTQDGDGACHGVADAQGSVLWTNCKDRMLAFSPDSTKVLATTSSYYGSGEHQLTVLDARTGRDVLRLRTGEDVGIYEMVWEDDDHVLAVVSDWKIDPETEEHTDLRWAVVRIGLDGSREYAVEPVPGEDDDYDGPLDLPRG